jgi:HK97 gp10 family phage protein
VARNASVADYQRRLQAAARAAVTAAYQQTLIEARQIAQAMKSAVPRGETGDLAESIRIETEAEKGAVHIKAGSGDTRDPNSSYNYARAQEFGTTRMSANPFFFPTFRLLAPAARRRMNKAAKEAMETAFGK